MAKEYLKDTKFLKALDEMRIKEHFISLQIMNFKEEPIKIIQGMATAGSITINGQSAVRRTINLTMVASEKDNDITNLDNIIACNKKVRVELGIKNPFKEYKFYGDIVWFPLGVYLITEANSQTSATSATISIKGKDKMSQLDGTCGGILPATVTFHELQTIKEDGEVAIEKVPIFTIIKECVKHYGEEIEENIIINDIDFTAKQSIKYIGSTPIWFDDDFKLSPIISNTTPENGEIRNKYVCDQEIGYKETDFTFPGELVFQAGEPVTAVLDKIIQTIGNYEYFYDLDGHFIFQEKKNYLNHYYTPIIELNDGYYIRSFSDSKYYNIFENSKDVVSYFNNPKYENIKNDYVVWGTSTTSDGVTRNIKYHLAIDEKPVIDLADQYLWERRTGNDEHIDYFIDRDKQEYVNTPNGTLIELKQEENLTKSEIKENIIQYLNNLYKGKQFTENTFILYVKITQKDKISYYRVKIKNQEVIEIFDLHYYEDFIKDEKIIIGILEEEDKKGSGENNNNDDENQNEDSIKTQILNYINELINLKKDYDSQMINILEGTGENDEAVLYQETKSKYDTIIQDLTNIIKNNTKYSLKNVTFEQFIKINIQNVNIYEYFIQENNSVSTLSFSDNNGYVSDSDNIDEGFNNNNYPNGSGNSGNSGNNNSSQNNSSSTINTVKRIGNPYRALSIKHQNNVYELGFYDKNKDWKKVYELQKLEDLTLKQMPYILNSIKKQYPVRIYHKKDFNKDNKNDFSFINSINQGSNEYGDLQLLKDSNNNDIKFSFVFEDLIKNKETILNELILKAKEEERIIIKDLFNNQDWEKETAIEDFKKILAEQNPKIELSSEQEKILKQIKNPFLTKENREKMIKSLVPFCIDNSANFKLDLDTIWANLETKDGVTTLLPLPDKVVNVTESQEITQTEQSQNQNPSSSNNIDDWFSKFMNGILSFFTGGNFSSSNSQQDSSSNQDGINTPSQKKDSVEILIKNLKVLKDKKLVELIIQYLTNKTKNDLIKEIGDYWINNVVENEEHLLKIITYYPSEPILDYDENVQYHLIGTPCTEWREELYRQALLNKDSAGAQGYYDEELLAFWRENFDTMNEDWKKEWGDYLGIPFKNEEDMTLEELEIYEKYSYLKGWNPIIYKDPGLLKYWLDFIDADQLFTKYSVNKIGRRSKVITKENIKVLYRLEVPDVIFIENKDLDEKDLALLIEEYDNYGQKYCLLKPNEMKSFSSASIGTTAFDLIREMLFTNLSYQTSVTINCIPKYYLEPNNLIYISDKKSGIQGDYFINQLTVPLTYNGTMSISTSQTVMRI